MAMSIALREVLYLMNLMDELRKFGVKLIDEKPIITCDVLEDNVGAIELAKLPKLRPRTKHMAIQYHHFRSWTAVGPHDEPPRIRVRYIKTELQQADIMTKPLPRQAFQRLRKLISGW